MSFNQPEGIVATVFSGWKLIRSFEGRKGGGGVGGGGDGDVVRTIGAALLLV